MFNQILWIAGLVGLGATQGPLISSSALPISNVVTSTMQPSATVASEPCAVVSSSLAALVAANPSGLATVDADIGYQCLNSVPLDTDGDLQLLNDFEPYLEWQSTLAYLKNPPTGYPEPAVDAVAQLDNITAKLENGEYNNEYELQVDIATTFTRAHDGHFYFLPDILDIIAFTRGTSLRLVSVSTDGVGLPEVYVYEDLVQASLIANFTPSAVTSINSQNVVDYLTKQSETSFLQDPDARYQELFVSQARKSYRDGDGSFLLSRLYVGPSTSLTFKNGTKHTYPNIATVLRNFAGVDSGESLFQTFCNGSTTAALATAAATATATTTSSIISPAEPTATGYPYPVVKFSQNAIGGYFLNDTGYTDVAVLSIPAFFQTDDRSLLLEFQSVTQRFLAACKSARNNKKRLIVDLRGNPGGATVLGFDTFKQLFPLIEPYGGTRFRANEAFNTMGQAFSDYFANVTAQNVTMVDVSKGYGLFLDYRSVLNEQNKNFTSWNDLYGPQEIYGDNFTSIVRNDFNSFYSEDRFYVAGYGNATAILQSEQPFVAEDIVMLHDGNCGSACAIFSELMKDQGKVQTIVVGGRPQNGPMQGIAGTKGAQDFDYGIIQALAQGVHGSGTPDQRDEWDNSDLGRLIAAQQPLRRTSYSGARPLASLNIRNNYRRNDKTQTPLQFVYEAADCRLWYTPAMVLDVTETWKAVARAKWGNGTCVAGSKAGPGSLSAGGSFTGNSTTASATPSVTPPTASPSIYSHSKNGAEILKATPLAFGLSVVAAALALL